MQFLERPGCHLCEDAWAVVVAAGGEDRVTRVDIDEHDGWVRDYGLRIPVLLDRSGAVIAEGHFAKKTIKRSLRSR